MDLPVFVGTPADFVRVGGFWIMRSGFGGSGIPEPWGVDLCTDLSIRWCCESTPLSWDRFINVLWTSCGERFVLVGGTIVGAQCTCRLGEGFNVEVCDFWCDRVIGEGVIVVGCGARGGVVGHRSCAICMM
jgi:hypothetical protein